MSWHAEVVAVRAVLLRNALMASRNVFFFFELLFWPIVGVLSIGLMTRFLGLTPAQTSFVLVGTIAVINVVYGAFSAMAQTDLKYVIAYSSVSHMGLVMLGAATLTEPGLNGSVFQMFAHGIMTGLFFALVGLVYEKAHSREIFMMGGFGRAMPGIATAFTVGGLSSLGLPATAGFVGEWMVILGAVQYNFWIGLLAATTLVFGAAYTLWMVKRVYFGTVANDDVKALADLNQREFFMLALLAIGVLVMGLYPQPFTDVMQASVTELLKHVSVSKLN